MGIRSTSNPTTSNPLQLDSAGLLDKKRHSVGPLKLSKKLGPLRHCDDEIQHDSTWFESSVAEALGTLHYRCRVSIINLSSPSLPHAFAPPKQLSWAPKSSRGKRPAASNTRGGGTSFAVARDHSRFAASLRQCESRAEGEGARHPRGVKNPKKHEPRALGYKYWKMRALGSSCAPTTSLSWVHLVFS